MLKLILPVVVQQDLLLECKPLADWLKDDILLDKGKYILGTNSDPFLLAVEKVLMDHRMVIHNNNLPGCWVTPPSTQIIATGSDVLIDQELGSMRRAQEVAVADKKTPKMWWGGGWSRSLSFCVSLVSSCWSLSFPPPPHLLWIGSWKRRCSSPHYPTKCTHGLLLRGRGSNHYCPHCHTHLCPRHWGYGLCLHEHCIIHPRGFILQCILWLGRKNWLRNSSMLPRQET